MIQIFLNLQKLLLRHYLCDIYKFLIIKYILGPKNVIWICINYQSWRRAPGMRYHGFVYANST